MRKKIAPTILGLMIMFLVIGLLPRGPFRALGLSDLVVGLIVVGLSVCAAYFAASWLERKLNRP